MATDGLPTPLEMLRKVEWVWSAHDVGDYEKCMWCNHYPVKGGPYGDGGGHAEDCELAAVLRENA
jgi:hypothetical protein